MRLHRRVYGELGTGVRVICPRPGPVRRVVIVDDDAISRRGMASMLEDSPRISVTGSLSLFDALGSSDRCWDEVDSVIIDPANEHAPEDHFSGVAVVDRVRRYDRLRRVKVIVVTRHFFDDAVRRRLREACADYFYHRAELHDPESLHRIVLHPSVERRVPDPIDPEAQFRHGVTDVTRVNLAVRHALDLGLMEVVAEPRKPHSRAWLKLRREFNGVARLSPMTVDGLSPARSQADPSLLQIARFLAWATRVKTAGSLAHA